MDRFPCAEHLNNEEVNYELQIRGRFGDVTKSLDLAGKQRLLRMIFRDDLSKKQNYQSSESVSDYFCLLGEQLSSIEKSIHRKKMDAKNESRLLHYWYRAKRLQAASEDQKKMRRDLVRRIENVMSANKVVLPTTPMKEQIRELLTQNITAPGTSNHEQTGNPRNSLGTIPKPTATPARTEVKDPVDQRLSHMEEMITAMWTLMSDSQGNRTNSHETPSSSKWTQHQFNTSPTVRKGHLEDDEDESEEDDSFYDAKRDNRTRDKDRGYGQSDSESESHRDYRPRTRHGGRGDDSHRVEKWKIKFSGDSRSLSVEDFLYKVDKLSEIEGVPKTRLLRDIHLLLEGSASDWFFTYIDNFHSWDNFEKLMRTRFGNPNKDQGIRLKIHNRKQQRGESFIAYVTEIEKLNRMLSRRMSKRRKFEVIWDNMRHHYHDRISVVDVENLDHLIKLNHKIDATDLSLQASWDPQPRRGINNIDVGSDPEENEKSADVNVMNSRSYHQISKGTNLYHQQTPPPKTYGPQQQANHAPVFQQQQQANQPPVFQQQQQFSNNHLPTKTACWNCQQEGHGWRDCSRPRVIFCFGCGKLGRTIRTCESCSAKNYARTSRQQQGN